MNSPRSEEYILIQHVTDVNADTNGGQKTCPPYHVPCRFEQWGDIDEEVGWVHLFVPTVLEKGQPRALF